MKVELGKMAGFCFGIRNAVEQTLSILQEEKQNIYCLGELTHNTQVMNKIKASGAVIVNSIGKIKNNSTIIIRAHGVAPDVYKMANEKHLIIKDLTCPRVLKIHDQAIEYKNKGYYIFLIAENNHPETIGTIGFCGENACIIEDLKDINKAVLKFKQSQCKEVVAIAQTTYAIKKFDEIAAKLKEYIPDIKINNTICNATNLRQTETEELSKNVELMIIIGGKNSSNTKKLYEISKNNSKQAIWIETKEELNIEEVKKFSKVGIMAGASTPKESIDDVVNLLKEL